MVKGFFFDLDGTLVDTDQANYEAYRHAIADAGVIITEDDFKKTAGYQAQTFLPWLAPGLSKADYLGIAERKATYYRDVLHLSQANVSLITFLREITVEHKTALVTTAKQKSAEAVLRHHGLTDLFDTIVIGEDVAHHKPEPDAYLLALSRLSLQPNEVIAFEDSAAGMEAAQRAHIAVVPIGTFRHDA